MSFDLVQANTIRGREICPPGFGAATLRSVAISGQSRESLFIQSCFQEVVVHYLRPVSRLDEDPYLCFYSLAASWKENVRHLSDTNEICMEEHYQQIIGMGEVALQFIFMELREDVENWFWALKAITRNDPVPEAYRGRMDLMSKYWLEWASKHGY